MHNQYSENLQSAAQAILSGNREDTASSLEVELVRESPCPNTFLLYALSCDSLSEAEEAVSQALELDPENELATAGARWFLGLRTLAEEIDRAELHEDESQSITAQEDNWEEAEEEAEAQRVAEEEAEAQRVAEEEAEAQRVAEEETEAQRVAEEETEAQRVAEEEAEAQRVAEKEAEVQRVIEEAEAKRTEEARLEEEDRLAEEAEARRLAEEEEAEEAEQKEEEKTETASEADEVETQKENEIYDTVNEIVSGVKSTITPAFTLNDSIVSDEAKGSDDVAEANKAEVEAKGSDEDITESSKVEEPQIAAKPLVLTVDDSPTIRKLVTMTLSREGFEVVSAADGIEALTLLAERVPSIILSDINMPRLDGYKLCKFVKRNQGTKHIPVILLSGKDGVFDKMRGKMSGCDGYITKPFESNDLLEKVRSFIAASV